jgi:hypothetical protein
MPSKRRNILHPGDILLFKPRGNVSFSDTLIIWGQKLFRQVPRKDKYVHVALVDRDTRFILEAKWPKTRRSNLITTKSNSKYKIEVYRVRGITEEQIKFALDWAHEHLDEWYDVPLFLTGFLYIKHTQICSTYVSNSFKAAKLDIPYGCGNKKFIVPDDYAIDNARLERIM